MSWDAILFLIEHDWIFLLLALAIGIVTGWISTTGKTG
jgi:hypothetical protein